MLCIRYPKTMTGKTIGIVLLFLLNFSFCPHALAWTDELYQAINAIGNGTATEQQKALAFANNRTVNNMALNGKIGNTVYQKVQKGFAIKNAQIAQQASAQAGATMKVQQIVSPTSPGTDSDFITSANSQKQITVIKKSYNQKVDSYLSKNGVKPSGKVDWTKRTDTDIMANAKTTSPKEFQAISQLNNDAYKRPGAARYEAFSRKWETTPAGKPKPTPNITDTSSYIQEMQEFVSKKSQASKANLKAQVEINKNPASKTTGTKAYATSQNLNAETFKVNSQQAKYIKRIQQATNRLATSHGVTPPKASSLPKLGAERSVGSATGKASYKAASVSALNEHLTQQAIKNHSQVLGKIAKANAVKNPATGKFAQKSIAQITKNLPASQKAEVLQALKTQAGVDDEFVKGVVKEMRKAAAPPKKGRWLTSTETGKFGKAVGAAGLAMTAVQVIDIAKETYEIYKTGDTKGAAKTAAIKGGLMAGQTYVFGKMVTGGTTLAAKVVGTTAASAGAQVLGTGLVAYGATREIMTRVKVGGKTLDDHTQEKIDEAIFKSSTSEKETEAARMQLLLKAVKSGNYKLPPDWKVVDAWKTVLKNAKAGKPLFGFLQKIEKEDPSKITVAKTEVTKEKGQKESGAKEGEDEPSAEELFGDPMLQQRSKMISTKTGARGLEVEQRTALESLIGAEKTAEGRSSKRLTAAVKTSQEELKEKKKTPEEKPDPKEKGEGQTSETPTEPEEEATEGETEEPQEGQQPPPEPGEGTEKKAEEPTKGATQKGIEVAVVGNAANQKMCDIVDGQLVHVEPWKKNVSNMVVQLTSKGGGAKVPPATSNTAGKFSFQNVPAGNYTISVQGWSYGMTSAPLTAPEGKAIRVVLKGSCPYLYVWTGAKFKKENDLFSTARLRPAEIVAALGLQAKATSDLAVYDIVLDDIPKKFYSSKAYRDYYRIKSSPAANAQGMYRFKIRERAGEHSFTNLVKLMAVMRPDGYQVGVTRQGRFFYYHDLKPVERIQDLKGYTADGGPVELYDREGIELKLPPAAFDQSVLAVTWQGFLTGKPEGHSSSPGRPHLALQRLNPEGRWQAMDWIYPRDEKEMAFLILDRKEHGWDIESKVRLVATNCLPEKFHRVDYPAWGHVTGPSPQTVELPLKSAHKTGSGEIRHTIVADDDRFLSLGPSEEVLFEFDGTVLANGRAYTFFFVADGFYIPAPLIQIAAAQQ